MVKRVVDPEICRKRILHDQFLYNTYSQIYLTMCQQYQPDILKGIGWTGVSSFLTGKRIIEIGSAGGILKEFLEFAITSDVRHGSGVDEIQDAQNLSFPPDSIDLILGKDVLHHIPDVTKHFAEIVRTLTPGGKVVYLEPNWNLISRFVFKCFHPEIWNTKSREWKFTSSNPMDANQALARNIFVRDSAEFQRMFPCLKFEILEKPINGLSFLFSGGVTMRSRVPSKYLLKINKWENSRVAWMKLFGFNRFIVLTKVQHHLDFSSDQQYSKGINVKPLPNQSENLQ